MIMPIRSFGIPILSHTTDEMALDMMGTRKRSAATDRAEAISLSP